MTQRFFIQMVYEGTRYGGWQIQPNTITIQKEVETALSKIYNQQISVVGCGRTDAGVHASDYYFHVDLDPQLYDDNLLLYKLNGLTPFDIAFRNVYRFEELRHARFDASSRSYEYHIHFEKNPFLRGHSYKYNQSIIPDFNLLQEAAELIKSYKSFYTFCKSHTQVDNFKCDIMESKWEKLANGGLVYHVTANRFLRGMVRLLVGMCINVSIKKYPIKDVHDALEKQERLTHAWSVPAEGLFLSKIKYPYINS